MTPLLEVRDVTKEYVGGGLFGRHKTVALANFSLAFSGERPTVLAIAGESGSGKTTLARLILGFISPTQGQVLYQGKPLQSMSRAELMQFRREVQAVYQDPFEVYNPYYKVDRLLTTPIAKFGLANSRAEAQEMVERALQGVGLRPEETLGRYPHQLSGGQRQRITIARALLLNPRILVADEPVSMVDASLRATILESLLKLNEEFGISLFYITHDLATAYQLCEDIIILYQGCVAEVGDVELVIQDPQHPYTQLLISSVPHADPDLQWGWARDRGEDGGGTHSGRGCKFAERCPRLMDVCRDIAPPLFRTNGSRATACHLYADSPATEATDVLTGSPR